MINHPLRRFREEKGLSQGQLGALLGISRQMVGLIENGDRRVQAEKVVGWEEKTGIPRHQLRPDIFAPVERHEEAA